METRSLALFFCLSFYSLPGFSQSSSTPSVLDVGVVLLSEGADGSPVGELDLGRVDAGSVVKANFRIKNGLQRSLFLKKVRPSCSCVDVLVPSGQVDSGQETKDASVLVKVPQVRSSRLSLADIVLVEDGENVQYGEPRLRLFARVDRPIYFPIARATHFLSNDERFVFALGFFASPELDLSTVRIVPLSDKFDVVQTRKEKGSSECQLEISGLRSDALDERLASFDVALKTEELTFSDKIEIEFFDGSTVRIVPSLPSAENGLVRFSLFRRQGFANSDVSISVQDQALVTKSKPLGKSIIAVEVTIPTGYDAAEGVLALSIDGVNMNVPFSNR